jgi:hypothetical protein
MSTLDWVVFVLCWSLIPGVHLLKFLIDRQKDEPKKGGVDDRSWEE